MSPRTIASVLAFWLCVTLLAARAGELDLKIIDAATGEPIAARLILKDKRGKLPRVPKLPAWQDHVLIDGQATINLPNGTYTFEVERGLEYRPQSGHFEFTTGAKDTNTIAMRRFVDMAKEGWWSGDTMVCRKPDEMPLLLRVEDLHAAAAVTWSTAKNDWLAKKPPAALRVSVGNDRMFDLLAGEDACPGGSLLLAGLAAPPTLLRSSPTSPPSMTYLAAADARGATTIAATPFALDLPVWAASGKLDAIQIAHPHLLPAGMVMHEGGGKARDRARYPDPFGSARWGIDLYYHLLNCGLRIAPSAGSGSGQSPAPAGYNRVYVHLHQEFSWDAWWRGLAAGNVVVTNGPLLRPLCEGHPPGHVFRGEPGQELSLQFTANLATRDPVDYFEVVQNGRVVHEVRLDKWAEMGGELPSLKFKESGWCLVRVVTTNPQTYRFATSGPFYVDFGKPRIRRASAQFLADWVEELRARALKLPAAEQPAQLAEINRAAAFWKALVAKANAE